MSEQRITHDDEPATRDLLVGRRIIKAETGEFEIPVLPDYTYHMKAAGRLTLDDGTTVLVAPNEGCGGCDAGFYELEHLATVDNAITDVRVATEGESDEYGTFSGSYRVYVMADAVEINAIQVDGNDGNGYYGTGYELFVVPPSP